ncbi:MAG: aliphatic nitrilase, partial [Proteobacteria bacterium]
RPALPVAPMSASFERASADATPEIMSGGQDECQHEPVAG